MKYSILINQLAVVNNDLHDDTDLIDWALMDYIQQWITHPKAQKLGDKVWINYKHILTEMPLLGLKAKSSISNRVHKLESLGLIETEKDDSFRLFVKMTNKAHQVITFHECSQDTTAVPNEERGVHSQERGVPNEERGVPEIVHTTNNQALNHHEQTISIKTETKPKSTQTRNAYERAYLKRYAVSPLRGAKVNSLLCQFVDQVGYDDAPLIAEYYVGLNDQWYVKKAHDVATMLQNAQAIRTQWATGTNKTSIDYRNQERTSNNQSVQQRIEQRVMAGEL